jgi:hypothetical protein
MNSGNQDQLTRAVQARYGCEATYIQAVTITQMYDGQSVWEGAVHIFRLSGSMISDIAYVWFETGDRAGELVFFLHVPPIAGPRDAIKTHLVWGGSRLEQCASPTKRVASSRLGNDDVSTSA